MSSWALPPLAPPCILASWSIHRLGEALAEGSTEALKREVAPLVLASYGAWSVIGQDKYMVWRKIDVDASQYFPPFDDIKILNDRFVKGTVTLNRIATEASRAPKTEPEDDEEGGAWDMMWGK